MSSSPACESAELERGKRCDEVQAGYRQRLSRPHFARYTLTADEFLLQRVLHSCMEPDLHLDEQ